MTQLNQTIDSLRQRHKSGCTGICDTCDLIWPCPPIRTMLIALGALDDEDTEHAVGNRIRNGLSAL